jgi:hypothetical protein
MWWRLLEVGERIESGDEYWQFNQWKLWPIGSLPTVKSVEDPVRRRVPISGAEISAGKDRPENLVKLGDHVGINCGTWFGCTGRVVAVSQAGPRIMLDNVYDFGKPTVITEPLDNVTVLVEPVAETNPPGKCPVCGVIA